MGSKFSNLNVYGADPAAVEALCPGAAVRSLAGNWVTAAGGYPEWGTAQKEAKRLSKALPCPVLSTEYFDDDYVEFAVYRGGKRTARHVPAGYEGFPRSPGKSRVWAEQLGLTQEAERILRTVFRETSPEASLRLMECVLGCPLWVDAESMDSAAPPGQAYLTAYLERKNAEKKIRNATRLVLLDEVEGDFHWRLTEPFVRNEYRGGIRSFWGIRDGALWKLFEKAVPGRPDDSRLQCRGEDASLLTFMEPGPETCRETAYVLTDAGETLETFDAGSPMLLSGGFLDRDRMFLEGVCRNIRTHENEWDMETGQTAYGIAPPCRLAGGQLATVYDLPGNPPKGRLAVMQPDGSGRVTAELPTFRHWKYPAAYGDNLLLGCGSRLICYGPSLEKLWSVELGEDVGQLGKPFPDIGAETLYFSTYRRITAFDLKKRQIRAVRPLADGEDCYLSGVLPGTGPIVLTGDSSIQVWNPDLTPVSRHRTKGAIGEILHRDGRVYILANVRADVTIRRSGAGWEAVPVKQGRLRLYELI
ncbi:hypothetical protein [Dysosmobacter sp.]|uniref:hypothetical protein n=1 Tax=Dysosmobacter sp. TaxID=2591382 RepID=UPI002A8CB81C|nr:hypothetical protein [Dysosmobacter sp.]MDY3282802.1 hypothetical protein [Dysosmobacter sp.]